MTPTAAEQSDGKRCPKCKAEGQSTGGEHQTAVHQYEGQFYGIEAHVIDVSWRCWNCGHEWGFEPSPAEEER